MTSRRVSWVLYWIFAAVFAVAGAVKVGDPESFLSSILTYEFLPYSMAVAVALYIPWLEIVLAISLATGVWRRGAVWLSSLLLLVFIALVVQGRIRGLAVDCGCFGNRLLEDDFAYAKKIGENLLLLACLWGGAILEGRQRDSAQA